MELLTLQKKQKRELKHYDERERGAGRHSHTQFVLLLFSLDNADLTKVHHK